MSLQTAEPVADRCRRRRKADRKRWVAYSCEHPDGKWVCWQRSALTSNSCVRRGEVVDPMQQAVGPYPSLKVCDGDQLEGEVVRIQV